MGSSPTLSFLLSPGDFTMPDCSVRFARLEEKLEALEARLTKLEGNKVKPDDSQKRYTVSKLPPLKPKFRATGVKKEGNKK